MSAGRVALEHSFTVSSVDIEVETDTFVNVLKRREEVLFRTTVPAKAASIAYVGSNVISASSNLSITDRSTSLLANRVKANDETTISSTDTFTTDTENFVVTDEYTSVEQTIIEIPLFYKHILSTDNLERDDDGDLVSTIKIISIDVLDNLMQPVQTPELKSDTTQGIVYNNLLSEYTSSGDYELYYIKYVVNDNSVVKTYIDLLDNVTTYRLAEFADLTETLELPTDKKVYLIEEFAGNYQVTLPASSTYTYKSTVSARIQILPANNNDIEDQWLVRVSNGRFYTELNSIVYKYYVAEFLDQSFSPFAPIKQAANVTVVTLLENLIKLDHQSIYQDADYGLYVNILVADEDVVARAAYTTNPDIVGTTSANGLLWKQWSYASREGIRSIDHRTGLVEIEGIDLASTDIVTASYSYEELSYEFSTIDFNPISDPDIIKTRTSLYIDPDRVGDDSLQTLFYVTMDDTGKVTESDWVEFDNATQTYAADGLDLYYERLPTFLQTTTSGNPDYIDPATHLFVDEFSVEGTNNGVFLILGDLGTSEAIGIDDLLTIDSRVRGGGIAESQLVAARIKETEVDWCWDISHWDGKPFPGNACYMVEVPLTVMEDAGGTLQGDDLYDLVRNHTAEGIYPLIRGYGIEIDYLQVLGGSDIVLKWHGYNTNTYSTFATDGTVGHTFEVV